MNYEAKDMLYKVEIVTDLYNDCSCADATKPILHISIDSLL